MFGSASTFYKLIVIIIFQIYFMWSIDKFFTKQIDSYREEDDVLEDVVFCNPLNSYHLEILPSKNRNIAYA